jgi:hypothetical protein
MIFVIRLIVCLSFKRKIINPGDIPRFNTLAVIPNLHPNVVVQSYLFGIYYSVTILLTL